MNEDYWLEEAYEDRVSGSYGSDPYEEVGEPWYELDEPEDEEPTEPEEEDYFLMDFGYLGAETAVFEVGAGFCRAFSTDDEALDHIRQLMRGSGIFTNVWRLSDGDNWTLLNIDPHDFTVTEYPE